MKKIIRYTFLLFLCMLIFLAWRLFGPITSFEEEKKSFYIRTGSSLRQVEDELDVEGIVHHTRSFKLAAKLMDFKKPLPGKYVFERGTSIFKIIRVLKSGRQTPVNLVITKLRTKEDLAAKIGANFEEDQADVLLFLSSNDSLRSFDLDSNMVMTAIQPNSYSLLWTTPFAKIFKRLASEQQKFWNEDRKKKAAALNLSPQQVYTLASIVEEETNKEEDKGKIASVYLNRLNKGMKLGADPTIKFALRDFGLRRIYEKYLKVQSPYNTYLNAGLPPGPICTATPKTIDAVLDAPATNYLYFVAKPDLKGYSNFSATYEEHLRNAKAYQQALDTFMLKKKMEPLTDELVNC